MAITFNHNDKLYVSGSNVGIGTASPSEALHINRNAASAEIRLQNNTISSYIRSNTDNLNFYVSNGEKMRITSSGNVGIGTTSPGAKLEVNGDGTNTGGIALREGTNQVHYIYTDGPYQYNTIGSSSPNWRWGQQGADTKMALNNTGLGIGTTSPSAKLHISGDVTGTNKALIENTDDGTNSYAGLGFQSDFGHTYHPGILLNSSTNTAYGGVDSLNIWQYHSKPITLVTNNVVRAIVTGDGKVGIGTTDPTPKLHLVYTGGTYSTDATSGFINQADTGRATMRLRSITDNPSELFFDIDGGIRWDISARPSAQSYNLNFYPAAATAAYNQVSSHTFQLSQNGDVIVTGAGSSGKMGIGTTSPSQKLDVSGNAYISGTLYVNTVRSATGSDIIVARDESANTVRLGSGDANDTIKIYAGGGATPKMFIDTSGNVGIGTTSPAQKLHVKGDIRADFNNTDGSAYLTGYGVEFERGTNYLRPRGTDGTQTLIFGGGSDTLDWNNIQFKTSDYINFRMSGSDVFRINSSGNVGIGTTSPSHLLNLNSTDSNSVALTIDNSNTDDNGTESSEIRFRHYRSYIAGQNDAGSIIVGKEQAWDQAGDRNSYMSFGTRRGSDAVVEKMRITSDGKVGIGTTSPASKLHVNGDIRINNTDRFYVGNNASYITSTSNADIAIVANRHISFASVISGVEYERVRIEEGGNVGIGTTSPSRDLHVKKSNSGGQVRMEVFNSSNTANSHGVISIYSGGASGGDPFLHWKIDEQQDWSMGIDNSDGDKLKISKNFGPGTNDYLTVDTSGNVGIGSTAPAARLNVASTGANAYSSTITKGTNMKGIINALSNNADDMVGIYFGTGTTSEGTHWSGITGSRSQSTTDWSTQLNFYTHNEDVANINDATQKMVIKGNGNVGIGTTSPGAKLDVDGNIKLSGYIVDSNSEIIDFAINDLKVQGKHINAEFGVWARSYGTVRQMGIDGGAAHMGLYTSGTEKVRIDTSGNVGIGTTAPQQALHIKGATNALMMLEGDNDNGIAGCYYKTEDTDNTMNRTKGFFGFQGNNLYGNGYFTMWLDNVNDNGTVTASEERFRWERDGDFHADGDVIAYSTTTPSDIRLKTDVETIESASEKVSKLRGVEYTWSKGKLAGQREIGLIAQEVEAVVPEVVKEKELPLWDDSGESYKTVDYEKLVALLIESNKEMQEEIKQLKERLDGITK